MATIRSIQTLNTDPGNYRPGCNKQYFLGNVILKKHQRRECAKVYHRMISNHSTYFSMENYKADANLMIGDMMVTMTDDGDDDDVFISMLETRKRFWEMRIA